MKNFNDPHTQSRVLTMGELSSGIIHDLYTPLQNLKLCCEILQRNPDFAKKPDFVDDITYSVEQTISIVDALRHFLRNPKSGDERSFSDIYENILVILRPKYPVLNLQDVFEIDPSLRDSVLNVNASTGIHILFNIFNTVLAGMIQNQEKGEKVCVSMQPSSKEQIILIQDGKWLSPERFYELTEIDSKTNQRHQDLGMWLAAELVARTGGKLELITNQSSQTIIKWTLANK